MFSFMYHIFEFISNIYLNTFIIYLNTSIIYISQYIYYIFEYFSVSSQENEFPKHPWIKVPFPSSSWVQGLVQVYGPCGHSGPRPYGEHGRGRGPRRIPSIQ